MIPVEAPEMLVRAAALYAPAVLVIGLAVHRRPNRRGAAAAVVATVWNLAFLLVVNVMALRLGWWRFGDGAPEVADVPVDLWIGWALLWGAVPALVPTGRGAIPALSVPTMLVAADLVLMPAAAPVVDLSSSWLVGEGVAVAACLVPGLLLGRWTAECRRLAGRVVLQVGAFTTLVFFVVPSVVFATTGGGAADGWATLLDRPRWQLLLAAGLASPVIGMALQAVAELARHGGTPVPLDPPPRLATTGPYAYVANPMQLAGALLFAGWGLLLGSLPLTAGAVVVVAFSAGLAGWSEDTELERRFGEDWRRYRRRVRLWLPSWRPQVVEPAAVHVAESCEPCAQVGRFLRRRPADQLEVLPAELCGRPLRRITYERREGDGDGGQASGIAAIGRSLEHVNLAWAAMSWVGRLPGVEQLLQLITDVVVGTPGATAGPETRASQGPPAGVG